MPGHVIDSSRDEALISMVSVPPNGSHRGMVLLVAYYDPVSKSVRPQAIDLDRSRIRPVMEAQ
jgi:hypothetical protein